MYLERPMELVQLVPRFALRRIDRHRLGYPVRLLAQVQLQREHRFAPGCRKQPPSSITPKSASTDRCESFALCKEPLSEFCPDVLSRFTEEDVDPPEPGVSVIITGSANRQAGYPKALDSCVTQSSGKRMRTLKYPGLISISVFASFDKSGRFMVRPSCVQPSCAHRCPVDPGRDAGLATDHADVLTCHRPPVPKASFRRGFSV